MVPGQSPRISPILQSRTGDPRLPSVSTITSHGRASVFTKPQVSHSTATSPAVEEASTSAPRVSPASVMGSSADYRKLPGLPVDIENGWKNDENVTRNRSNDVCWRDLLSTHGQLKKLRDHKHLVQARLDHEWQKLMDWQRFLGESQAACFTELGARVVAGPPEIASDSLSTKYQQVQSDYSRLTAQSECVKREQTRLNGLEYRLARIEDEFVAATSRVMGERVGPLPTDSQSVKSESIRTLSSADASSNDVPSVLTEYFDKAGDAFLARERLHEVEFKYQEEKANRDWKAEQDFSPLISDEEFECQYFSRRRQAEEDLMEACSIADRLKAECLTRGINPEDKRRRRAASSDIDIVSESPGISHRQIPFAFRKFLLPEIRDAVDDRVSNWLDDIPNTQVRPTAARSRSEADLMHGGPLQRAWNVREGDTTDIGRIAESSSAVFEGPVRVAQRRQSDSALCGNIGQVANSWSFGMTCARMPTTDLWPRPRRRPAAPFGDDDA